MGQYNLYAPEKRTGLMNKKTQYHNRTIMIQTHGFHTYILCDKVIEIWLWMWHSNMSSRVIQALDVIYLTFSPHILWGNLISLGNMVTHFVWIVQRLVSSRRHIRYAWVASCNASTTPAWISWSPCSLCKISLTSHRNGTLGMSNSVDFWNLWISHNACVPGLNHLLLLSVLPTLGFIFLNLLILIHGVFPFCLLTFSPL